VGSNVSFKRPDGESCDGYLDESAAQGAPGVVVLQEWWGVNDQIKGVADFMAAEGFRALVPDLYHGKVTLEAAEAGHLMGELDFGAAASQDIRGAVQYLKQQGSGKVGVIGFCMGGALSVLAAAFVPEADVAVSWYGLPPLEAADFSKLDVAVQLHVASQDTFFSPAMAEAMTAKFKEGGVTHEYYLYDAVHAFGNEENPNHDPELTKLAWERSLQFLRTHLA
jgi:carboxymethylenebutenolidase